MIYYSVIYKTLIKIINYDIKSNFNFSTGEKFKEALRATFNNVPIPSAQPSLRRNGNSDSIIRKDNNKNNVAGMELQRAPTLQDQQMILEVEGE